jgi:outer membrane scaffolding protein for murein synthesis (MipA/OmpV family)
MSGAITPRGLRRVLAALALVLPLPAASQTVDGPHGVFIAAVGLVPAYEGADSYRVFPVPAGRVQWDERRYVALQGLTMLANVSTAEGLDFGPLATLTFGRNKDVDSAAVAALPEIADAASVGLFLARVWTGVGTDTGEARIEIQAAHDVTGVYDGWIASARAGYATQLGGRWRLAGEVAARIVGDDYASTYFSVGAADAAASGLAPFSAKGGMNDLGVSATASYALTERWSLTGFAGYSRLLGDAADSPIVADEGSANQFSAGFGLGFAF